METTGTIHDPKALMLRVHCGEAESENDGVKYDLATSMAGNPIVCSRKTGQWFSLSWSDIINLAISAGINEPTKKAKARKNKP